MLGLGVFGIGSILNAVTEGAGTADASIESVQAVSQSSISSTFVTPYTYASNENPTRQRSDTTVALAPVQSTEQLEGRFDVSPLASSPVYSTAPLRLRSGPGTDFAAVGTLVQGTKLQSLETKGDWLRTRSSLGEGWVHRAYVSLDAPR